MFTATIKSVVLDKAVSTSISLQVLATIENDTGNSVKFRISTDEGIILEDYTDFMATPVEISKFYFLNNKNYFDKNSLTVILDTIDSVGNTTASSKVINTFQINNFQRNSREEFQWAIRNFSTIPIYTMMQVVDSNGIVVANSSEYRKPYGIGYNYYKYNWDNIDSLPEGYYYYRLKYYSKDEEWNSYYPSESGIQVQVRANTNPRLKIKDTKIRKNSDNFNLTARVIFSDAEMDDITYSIIDNFGNILEQMTNYTYSPKLERLSYDYPLAKFNSSYLTVKVNVHDKLYGEGYIEETIKLYSIHNLYKDRDKFRWEFRNYSNKNILMQMEATDFEFNIIRQGNIMSMRDSFDYFTLQDSVKFDLPRDYYKYRLKVWCDEEGWIEYYSYEPFNGIQFTRRDHQNPVIDVIEASITRDLDDIRYLVFKANITDPENDAVLYTITDDAGTVIRKTRDPIDTPLYIDIMPQYDLILRAQVQITIVAEDDNGGTASQTVSAKAYNITGLKQDSGHIFSWNLDNHSIRNITMCIEILKDNLDTQEKDFIQVSNEYTVGATIKPAHIVDHLYPKLTPGNYYYRLRTNCEGETVDNYFPNEEGTPFTVYTNNPPIIELSSLELNKIDDTTFYVGLGGMITDKDLDFIKYSIKDQFNNVLVKSDDFIPSPVNLNVVQNYSVSSLETARLILSIDALDEGDAITTINEIINLFDVQNLYRDYDKFYWLFRNYSKIPVAMQIEILNQEGLMEGAGQVQRISSLTQYKEFKDIIDPNDYDEGNYFFRLKIFIDNETWVSYYPDMAGISFFISHNVPPKVTLISSNVSKIEGQDKYTVDLNASITDADGNKVYYVIKDDN